MHTTQTNIWPLTCIWEHRYSRVPYMVCGSCSHIQSIIFHTWSSMNVTLASFVILQSICGDSKQVFLYIYCFHVLSSESMLLKLVILILQSYNVTWHYNISVLQNVTILAILKPTTATTGINQQNFVLQVTKNLCLWTFYVLI